MSNNVGRGMVSKWVFDEGVYDAIMKGAERLPFKYKEVNIFGESVHPPISLAGYNFPTPLWLSRSVRVCLLNEYGIKLEDILDGKPHYGFKMALLQGKLWEYLDTSQNFTRTVFMYKMGHSSKFYDTYLLGINGLTINPNNMAICQTLSILFNSMVKSSSISPYYYFMKGDTTSYIIKEKRMELHHDKKGGIQRISQYKRC